MKHTKMAWARFHMLPWCSGAPLLSDICSSRAGSEKPDKTNILGVGVSVVNMRTALMLSDDLLSSENSGYICVTGVHGVMEAQADDHFRSILNRSFLTVPDGMPLVWLGKLDGYIHMGRVYGPDYMLGLCELSVGRGYRHFFYGGNTGIAEKLGSELQAIFPGMHVVGSYTPPFRPLNLVEESELVQLIAEAKPDILWVGLSTPKQERFMAEHIGKLEVRLMVGVGAAFDIHTGGIRDAPAWIKRGGLQWLHRLSQEPRRLWRRYLINNPRFVWKVLLQITGIRRIEIESI